MGSIQGDQVPPVGPLGQKAGAERKPAEKMLDRNVTRSSSAHDLSAIRAEVIQVQAGKAIAAQNEAEQFGNDARVEMPTPQVTNLSDKANKTPLLVRIAQTALAPFADLGTWIGKKIGIDDEKSLAEHGPGSIKPPPKKEEELVEKAQVEPTPEPSVVDKLKVFPPPPLLSKVHKDAQSKEQEAPKANEPEEAQVTPQSAATPLTDPNDAGHGIEKPSSPKESPKFHVPPVKKPVTSLLGKVIQSQQAKQGPITVKKGEAVPTPKNLVPSAIAISAYQTALGKTEKDETDVDLIKAFDETFGMKGLLGSCRGPTDIQKKEQLVLLTKRDPMPLPKGQVSLKQKIFDFAVENRDKDLSIILKKSVGKKVYKTLVEARMKNLDETYQTKLGSLPPGKGTSKIYPGKTQIESAEKDKNLKVIEKLVDELATTEATLHAQLSGINKLVQSSITIQYSGSHKVPKALGLINAVKPRNEPNALQELCLLTSPILKASAAIQIRLNTFKENGFSEKDLTDLILSPEWKNYVTLMSNYAAKHSEANKILEKVIKRNPWIKEHTIDVAVPNKQADPKAEIDSNNSQEITKLTIGTILITPAQRLPRWKLLFDEIVRKTGEEHKKELAPILDLIKKSATLVNEKIATRDLS